MQRLKQYVRKTKVNQVEEIKSPGFDYDDALFNKNTIESKLYKTGIPAVSFRDKVEQLS